MKMKNTVVEVQGAKTTNPVTPGRSNNGIINFLNIKIMKTIGKTIGAALTVIMLSAGAYAQKVIILSQNVGETIDSSEKGKYYLFPFYKKEEFQSAQFLQMPDSSIVLKAV